jgi:adenylyltransferase/sulfurtransferase
MERYSKQILFNDLGEKGQRNLLNSKVLVVGCGALGTVIANNLVRAGVGYVKIVDRDYVELSNLQRQMLFDESDIQNNIPKAIAAQEKLKKINSEIIIDCEVVDMNPTNAIRLCKDMDLILDGTDNFSTRFLINDVSIKLNIPWIYGGAIGSTGMVLPIIPGKTPCFRCLQPEVPETGGMATCDTIGVLNSTTSIVASLQSIEAIKILSKNEERLNNKLQVFDLWTGEFNFVEIQKNTYCTACAKHQWDFLNRGYEDVVYLCHNNSVQINPANRGVNFEDLIRKLERIDIEIKKSPYFLRFFIEDVQISVFGDGRAIMKNVSDTNQAKSLYAKYIGS